MLAFLGDIHGSTDQLIYAIDKIKDSEVKALIQVGDFGYFPDRFKAFSIIHPEIPVYFIDGNHEHFPSLEKFTDVTEVFNNIFYVPRGTVLELDNRKLAFCGGAASVDKQIRLRQNMAWYPEEEITDEQLSRLDDVDEVDILVTHTPPNCIINYYFPQSGLVNWGLPVTWVDPSAVKIEKLWRRLRMPKLICGHFHRSILHDTIRILDINEIYGM